MRSSSRNRGVAGPRGPQAWAAGHVPLERALSKLGLCSRSEARVAIAAGRVQVDGVVVRDALKQVVPEAGRIILDGALATAGPRRYLLLNKPRGLVTTTKDEQGRDTVYRCFTGSGLPYLAPVGRLDQASEGLLLFTNDSRWAAGVLDPHQGPDKTYHVQIDRVPDEALCAALRAGVTDEGEQLAVKEVRVLRAGQRHGWIEAVLDEGRNRHLRRLCTACGCEVLRLVRVAIGPLILGELPKGGWRDLTADEVRALGPV